jgi:hypothetical protein
MNDSQLKCIVCERTSEEVPVVPFQYQGKNFGICPEHLPIMIHKPHQLADKLPGIERMQGHEH